MTIHSTARSPSPMSADTPHLSVVQKEAHATLSGVTRYFQKSDSKELFHALGPIAVSYTHLTLPTKA